jgi:acyl-CoA reductase-like NAD-dependent aldehyde dehydrogenase
VILPVLDPWTLESIGAVEATPPHRIEEALARAHARGASMPPAHARARILDRAADAVEADAEGFAQEIRAEAGKPITLARSEVARAVGTLRLCAAEARTLAGEGVALEGSAEGTGRIGFTVREPRGVVLAITPFNFPLNLVAHKVGPAIAAGCPVVLKPAERTPLCAERLARVLRDAGAETGMLEVVHGVGADVVPGMIVDPRVAVVSFTGSAAVGRRLQALAPHIPVLLELGGAAAVLVDEDVDVGAAARAIVAGAYAYAGQSCISVQRVVACARVLDPLRDALLEELRALEVGAPSDPDVRVGPLIRPAEAARVRAWTAEAIAAGARLLAGDLAVRTDDPAGLLRPLLLDGVPEGARVVREEVFGPLACILGVGEMRDAVEVANRVPDALNVGVYTRDVQRALAASRALHAGAVVWNESPTWRADGMPYGSANATREGPRWTVRAFTREKLLVLGGS